jgi:hypothetical protein
MLGVVEKICVADVEWPGVFAKENAGENSF